ncbi:MAG: hypothetical protein K0V04_08640 [Deltaproteobacteria bacterium]|nr:hypothetical protein [Deltaproteobacteria bacterium]
MGWVVSTHAGWWRSTSPQYVTLPTSWSFVTYTADGEILPSDRAWMLLAALRSNDEEHALAQAHAVHRAYTRIPNYTVYGGNDFQAGVYRVGEARKTLTFGPGSVSTLHELVHHYLRASPGSIHWLACMTHA